MASNFTTKISFIIKEIQDLIFEKINDAKTTIQNWCNERFSLNTHGHDNYSDKIHNHVIADVTKLQTSLDNKARIDHTHSEYAESSHTHPQSDVTGLVTALAGKASTSHTHTTTELGVIGFPNYAASSLITGTEFTAPSNGWINVCPRSGPIWSFIDNRCFAYAATDCGGDAYFIPVSKGSVFKMTKNEAGTNLLKIQDVTRFGIRRFIPCK
ncbi:MAG: hypothetical protein IKA36_04805 [Clostridia bacterium]|nr:hypothetical protein [Clostridia bacterium]